MAIDKDKLVTLLPHQQAFADAVETIDATVLGETTRKLMMVNYGKSGVGRVMLEQGTYPAKVTGVDAGSKEIVIEYTIDEADDLFEAMALTMDSMDIYNDNVAEPVLIDWKTIEEKRLRDYETYIEGRRIPVSDGDIYKVGYGVEPGRGRGPKGGAAQRLAKRRKANKAARKARRHG